MTQVASRLYAPLIDNGLADAVERHGLGIEVFRVRPKDLSNPDVAEALEQAGVWRLPALIAGGRVLVGAERIAAALFGDGQGGQGGQGGRAPPRAPQRAPGQRAPPRASPREPRAPQRAFQDDEDPFEGGSRGGAARGGAARGPPGGAKRGGRGDDIGGASNDALNGAGEDRLLEDYFARAAREPDDPTEE